MKCDICNFEETYIKEHSHNYKIRGKDIKFIMPRRFCNNCNNLVYDPNLDNAASLKAIEIYNKNYGIPKEDVIKLHKKLGLSQKAFAKKIGCDKSTLISYEKGTTIPNDECLNKIKSLMIYK